MENPLLSLFYQLINPSYSNNISRISDALTQEYTKPESLISIIQILKDNSIPSIIHRTAAVSLSNVVKIQLQLLLSQQGSSFLSDIVSILENEDDTYIAMNIIYALNPIFEQTGESWVEMTQLVMKLLEVNDDNRSIIAINLLTNFLKYTSSNYLIQIMNYIIPMINLSLSSSNPNLVLQGFELFAMLQHFDINIQDYIQAFSEIYQRMIQLFYQMLVEGNSNASRTGNYLASSITSKIAFDSPMNLFNTFLRIIQDQNVKDSFRIYPLFPIKKLIKYFGSQIKQTFNETIPIFLHVSAMQFTDTGYANEEDSHYIYFVFKAVAQVTNVKELIKAIITLAEQTTEPKYDFAILSALHGCIDISNKEISSILDEIMKIIMNKIQTQNVPVIELSLIILNSIVSNGLNGFEKYAESIISLLLSYCKVDDEELVHISLGLLTSIFYNEEDLDSEFIIGILPELIDDYNHISGSLKYQVMYAISGIVISCNTDSSMFADSIIPLIWEGCQITSDTDVDVRCSCIEALCNLINFAPEKCQDIYEPGMNMILSLSKDNNDRSLRNVSLLCIVNMLKFKNGLSSDFYKTSLESAIEAVRIINSDDEMVISSTSVSDIIINGFKIIFEVIKHSPQTCQDVFNTLINIFNHIDSYDDDMDVFIEAIRSSVKFYSIFQNIETTIVNNLEKYIIESTDEELIAISFKSVKKLFIVNHPLITNKYNDFLMLAFQCMSRQLQYQLDSKIDKENKFDYQSNIMEPVHSLICVLINKNIQLFPSNEFLQLIVQLIPNVEEEEVNLIFSTLGIFVNSGGRVNSYFAQLCVSKLEICDFNYLPDPIYFFRVLIREQPDIVAEYIPKYIEFSIMKFNEEISGNYYYETIANISSSLLDICTSSSLSSLIDISQLVQLVISKLPVKGDYREGTFIYNTLLLIAQKYPRAIIQSIPNLFVGIIKTLSFKDATFNKYEFPKQTLLNLVSFVTTILSSQPQWESQIPMILNNNQFKIKKLQERLQIRN